MHGGTKTSCWPCWSWSSRPLTHWTRINLCLKEHAMATVRDGNKGVLVIVDVQVGVMRDVWEAARVIQNVSCAVERARAQRVPVLWVQHADEELAYGSPEWQWVPELAPAPGEPFIHKHFNSAFEQ